MFSLSFLALLNKIFSLAVLNEMFSLILSFVNKMFSLALLNTFLKKITIFKIYFMKKMLCLKQQECFRRK